MTWELREDGRAYYYRSVRKGGRPVRQYYGRGLRAVKASIADEAKRVAREAEAKLLRDQKTKATELDTLLNELRDVTNLITDATLVAAGFHKHHGQWRKRRNLMGKTRTIEKRTTQPNKEEDRFGSGPTSESRHAGKIGSPGVFLTEADTEEVGPRRLPTRAEALRILANRASAGNETCLKGLRQVLEDSPEIWEHLGDLAKLAERALIERAYPRDFLAAESTGKHIDALRQKLAGEDPHPLDDLLAAQVVITYVAYYQAEAAAADQPPKAGPVATFLEKRADSAHRRHVNSLMAMAKVQELMSKVNKPKAGP